MEDRSGKNQIVRVQANGKLLRVMRKERHPYWNRCEMLALVDAKRTKYLEGIDVDDPRSQMSNKGMSWNRVAVIVNLSKGITCYRLPDACKCK